jgi:hypothetical protein
VEEAFGAYAPFEMALGYLYVAVAEAGRAVLERRGTITEAG